MSVRPAKTQLSLGIRPVWSESLLCAQWVAKDPSFLHVDSEDSDQTGRISRLIWIFAGRILILLVLSCRGSFGFYSVGQFAMVPGHATALAYGRARTCCAYSRCGTGGLFFFFFFFSSGLSYLPSLMPHLLGDGWTYWNIVVSPVITQR